MQWDLDWGECDCVAWRTVVHTWQSDEGETGWTRRCPTPPRLQAVYTRLAALALLTAAPPLVVYSSHLHPYRPTPTRSVPLPPRLSTARLSLSLSSHLSPRLDVLSHRLVDLEPPSEGVYECSTRRTPADPCRCTVPTPLLPPLRVAPSLAHSHGVPEHPQRHELPGLRRVRRQPAHRCRASHSFLVTVDAVPSLVALARPLPSSLPTHAHLCRHFRGSAGAPHTATCPVPTHADTSTR